MPHNLSEGLGLVREREMDRVYAFQRDRRCIGESLCLRRETLRMREEQKFILRIGSPKELEDQLSDIAFEARVRHSERGGVHTYTHGRTEAILLQ